MDDTDAIIRAAEATGRRNQEIIDLARAWCTHIRRDRVHMGVGVIEQVTGLPVSGGTFTCDFARGPSPEGMRLDEIALDFYERNCATCTKRSPTGIVLHLGTWAQRLADERREAQRKREQELAVREAARIERARRRRLRTGQLNVVAQSIIELLERLDAETLDDDASDDLLTLARLHPEAFTPSLLEVLVSDAEQMRTEVCLSAAVTARQQQHAGVTDLVPVSLRALRQGWGFDTCAQLVAEHARKDDVDHDLVRIAIRRASSPLRHLFGGSKSPRPDLLLRLIDVAPEESFRLLGLELAEEDDWRRAAAAQATTCLLDSGIRPSEELVDWLFDALCRRNNPDARHADAGDAVEIAIATAMTADTALVERGIDRRWAAASTQDRIKLINCYSRYVHGNWDTPLLDEIPTAAAARALSCMLNNGVDSELLSEAANLLELSFRYHANQANVDINMALGALALICDAFDAAQEPSSPIIIPGREQKALTFFEKERQKSALTVAIRSLVVAISALAARDEAFWSGFASVWNNDPTSSPTLKVHLVQVLGEVAAEAGELAQALPYLYSALFGREQAMRAVAVAAFHRILEAEGTSNAFPEAVTLGLIRALSDQYLIVVAQACDVIGLLSIPQEQSVTVLNQLIHIATTYAARDEWQEMVSNALLSARALAENSQYTLAVDGAVLQIIASMRPYEAIATLTRMPSLSAHLKWTASAIRALRPDPQYDNLRDDDRRRLLRTIASQAPDLAAPHISELVEIAAHNVPHKPYRAWEIADVLSSLSFDEAAEKVARKALDAIPDTLSNRSYRLKTAALLACFRVEAACSRGDKAALTQALQDWNEAQVAADRDSEENDDARRPFRPAHISD